MAGGPQGKMRRDIPFREKIKLFRDRNYLLFWASGNISGLGDMFIMIASPLLIMNLTDNDPLAVGAVMAITGIPRVFFMLFGGVLIDKFSPLRMILFARYMMAANQLALATVCMLGVIDLWMLYVSAVVTGAVGSFLWPAQMTLMPAILNQEDLPAGNALNTSAQQILSSFAPALVGFTIALLSGYDIMASGGFEGDPEKELVAYGWAFGINAVTFVISALMLAWLSILNDERASAGEGMLRSIWAGFEYVWHDVPLRAFIIYIALSQFFTMGAQAVGQPMMGQVRFEDVGLGSKAVALGLYATASGAGSVIGSLYAGFAKMPSERAYGPVMMGMAIMRGAALMGLGYVTTLYGTLALFGVFGLFMGYTMVLFSTWMQTRVEISMLGRTMSVMMFAMMGLAPLSMGFAGVIIGMYGDGTAAMTRGLETLYYGCGVIMLVVAIAALSSRSIRLLGYTPEHAAEILAGKHPRELSAAPEHQAQEPAPGGK